MPIDIIKPVDRSEWLAARKQDVTASDASALLGIHPYKTAFELWAEKTGRKPDAEDNEVFRRGRALEYVAIDFLREDYPDWKITHSYNNRYFRDTDARIGATPDAFVRIPDRKGTGIIQIKSASDFSMKNWRDPETKEIVPPTYVAVQAIIEATLTGASYAFVALIVSGHTLTLHPPIEIPLHLDLMNRVRREVADFWRLTESGSHPDADWKRDGELLEQLYQPDGRVLDLRADNSLPGLLDEKATLAEQKSAIEKRQKEIKAELLDKMGLADPSAKTSDPTTDVARIADGRSITAKRQHRDGYTVKPTSFMDVRVKTAAA
jgi:putative phage-type endonuclease